MSAMFITYLWHYLAARAVYDELVRPLIAGDVAPLAVVLLIGAVIFCLRRRSAQRRRP